MTTKKQLEKELAELAPADVATVCADIRGALGFEITRLRETIHDETTPDEEALVRAQLAGLEWASARVGMLMTYHRVGG